MIQQFKKTSTSSDRYILVLSGGGTRGFYSLWVLKALEEFWYKEKIEAIYGISVGAMIASYRAKGYSAQEIFDHYSTFSTKITDRITLVPKEHLIRNDLLKEAFKTSLPKTFEALNIKTYIGATDIKTWKLIIFEQGNLINPLLGSIALPWIFPTIKYQHYYLQDGGIIDNFPTTTAKKQYPNHKVIWIALNLFKENQKPRNLIETLMISFDIMLKRDIVQRIKEVDISFCERLDCHILETNKQKRKKIFEQGYKSWKKILSQYQK